MTNLIDHLKYDLPNFPEEILESWLGYYAQSEGWPPNEDFNAIPDNRWKYLLGNRPVSFWQNLVWELRDLFFQEIVQVLKPGDISGIDQLLDCYVRGNTNNYAQEMGQAGKEKFVRMLRYLIKNGRFPSYPVLVEQNNILELIDGHHRMTTYMYWQRFHQATEVNEFINTTQIWSMQIS